MNRIREEGELKKHVLKSDGQLFGDLTLCEAGWLVALGLGMASVLI